MNPSMLEWRNRKCALLCVVLLAFIYNLATQQQDAPSAMTKAANAASPEQRPHAQGKQFATLDSYLEHRQRLGAIDLPWYREIEPNIYELQTGPLPIKPKKTRFTRDELLKKYGFER